MIFGKPADCPGLPDAASHRRGWVRATLGAALAVALGFGLIGCGDDRVPTAPRWVISTGPFSPPPPGLGPDDTVLAPTGTNWTGPLLSLLDSHGNKLTLLPGTAAGPDWTDSSDTIYTRDAVWVRALTEKWEPKWQVDLPGQMAVAPDGVVYTLGNPYGTLGDDTSKLSAILPHGEVAWILDLESNSSDPPVVTGDGRIVAILEPRGEDPHNYQLASWDLAGTELWRADVHDAMGSPAVAADGTVYQGTQDGVAAFGADGAPVWFANLEGGAQSLAIGKEGNLFMGANWGKRIAAVTPEGEELWTVSGHAPSGLTVGSDGRIYAPGVSTTGSYSGLAFIVVLNPNGEQHMAYNYGESTTGYIGSLAIAPGGNLYASSFLFHSSYNPDAIGGPSASASHLAFLESYESEAKGGLLDSSWPRSNDGGGGTTCGTPVFAAPTSKGIRGMWSIETGSKYHVMQLADELPDNLALATETSVYVLWDCSLDAEPQAVERGTWSLDSSTLTFAVLEKDSAPSSGTHTVEVGDSSPWQLVAGDPLGSDKKNHFKRIHSLPGPPSKSNGWGKTLATYAEGFTGDNAGLEIALTPDGAMVVAGYFAFIGRYGGGAPFPALGTNDLWLGRVGEDGWDWHFYLGDETDVEMVRGLTVEPDGTIIAAGVFPDPDGEGVVHLLAFTEDGEPAWSLDLGDGSRTRRVLSLDVANDGGLLLSGEISEAGQKDAVGTPNGWVNGSPFLTRLDSNHEIVWDQVWDAPGQQRFEDVAVDPDGRVVVIGQVRGTLDLGDGPLTGVMEPTQEVPKLLVASFEGTGELIWSKAFPAITLSQDQVFMDVGPDGAIVLAGSLRKSLDLGLVVLELDEDGIESDSDGFLASLDRDGNTVWNLRLGTGETGEGLGDVVVDTSGNIAVAAFTESSLTIGSETIETRGDAFFLLQFDACGRLLWSKDTRPGTLWVRDMEGTPDGKIAFTGHGSGGFIETNDGAWDWTHSTQSASLGMDVWGFFAGVVQGAGETSLEEPGVVLDCEEVFGDPKVQLKVIGDGGGKVVSDPPGVECTESCTVAFPKGTNITLTATAANDSHFAGWSGGCSGTGICELQMNTSRPVTARFEHPGLKWANVWGGDQEITFTGVAVGGDGAIYAIANNASWQPLDMGTGPLEAEGYDGALAAYEPDGSPRWVRPLAGIGKEQVMHVATWPSGDVVVVGDTTSPEIDLGTGPLSGETTVFVARYTAANEPVWAQRIEELKSGYYLYPVPDPSGALTLVGKSAVRLDAAGETIWTATGGSFEVGAAGPDGSVYVTGYRPSGPGKFYIDGELVDVPVGYFLAQLDANGSLLWIHPVAEGVTIDPPILASEPAGTIALVHGANGETLGFNGMSVQSAGYGLVAAIDPFAKPLWLDHIGLSLGYAAMKGVSFLPDGRLVLTTSVGFYETQVVQLDEETSQEVEDDILISTWTADGTRGPATFLGLGDGPEEGTFESLYAATTPDGDLVLGGTFSGTVNLAIPLTATATTSAFMVKLGL